MPIFKHCINIALCFYMTVFIYSPVVVAASESPPYLQWARQVSSPPYDAYGHDVALDAWGNIYLCGEVSETDYSSPNSTDAFLNKYDPAGNLLWSKEVDKRHEDVAYAVDVGPDGSIYLAGNSGYFLPGPGPLSYIGGPFLSKYDTDGNELWSLDYNYGTGTWSHNMATDAWGNVYLSGFTSGVVDGATNAGNSDAFVTKFDPAGNMLWAYQMGSTDRDDCRSVAVDSSGNVYITGITFVERPDQPFAAEDVFLTKLNASGEEQWTNQFGAGYRDDSNAVAIDPSGNIYITGYTTLGLDGETRYDEAFLLKFDPSGNELWSWHSGTLLDSAEFGEAITTDTRGNVYLTGYTDAGLDYRQVPENRFDLFVAKFDTSGSQLWTKQLGTGGDDIPTNLQINASGNIYISGRTSGIFGAETDDLSVDAFLIKLASSVTGDLNGDGFVGHEDLNMILINWNQYVQPGDSRADPSGDGYIGIADLNAVLGNWNAGTPPPPAVVPEPAAVSILCIAAAALLIRKNG